jgi:hypothetical protein
VLAEKAGDSTEYVLDLVETRYYRFRGGSGATRRSPDLPPAYTLVTLSGIM